MPGTPFEKEIARAISRNIKALKPAGVSSEDVAFLFQLTRLAPTLGVTSKAAIEAFLSQRGDITISRQTIDKYRKEEVAPDGGRLFTLWEALDIALQHEGRRLDWPHDLPVQPNYLWLPEDGRPT